MKLFIIDTGASKKQAETTTVAFLQAIQLRFSQEQFLVNKFDTVKE